MKRQKTKIIFVKQYKTKRKTSLFSKKEDESDIENNMGPK